jgi:hypothetical protein
VEAGLPVELVGGEVEVAVLRHGEGVGPEDAGVVGEGLVGPVGQPAQDGVVLVVAQVEPALVVGLQPVGGASLVAPSGGRFIRGQPSTMGRKRFSALVERWSWASLRGSAARARRRRQA